MERIAQCHCGQLRAITSGEPDSVYVCHCKACQRRTGAVIHNGSRWLRSQVLLRRPRFPGADLVRLGRVDARLARVAAGYCAFPASSLLKAARER